MHFLKAYLQHPGLYLLLQWLTGGMRARRICIADYSRYDIGERVLDVGCGSGYVVKYLPKADYVGTDIEPSYINYAKKAYGGIGDFHLLEINQRTITEFGSFDLILLNGVLHHVNDQVAAQVLSTLGQGLNENGRLLTLDGCYYPDTSMISRAFLNHDRGEYIRSEKEYQELAESAFNQVDLTRRRDLFFIPYDSVVMVCQRAR
ncbi:class I SAM-dependent methyltransferase [Rubripirellula sp.]|nr:class I SAM-dependent methyltransferase [Rubripirellula sp.]